MDDPKVIMLPPSPSSDYGGETPLRDILSALVEDRVIVGGIVFIALTLGVLHCFLTTPRYHADALVQVERKNRGITNSTDDLYELMAGKDSIATEIELVKSRLVLGKVVDDLHLDISAHRVRFPVLGRALARATGERDGIVVANLVVPDALLGKPLKLRASEPGSFELSAPAAGITAKGRIGELLTFTSSDGPGQLLVNSLEAPAGAVFSISLLRREQVVDQLKKTVQVIEQGRASGILNISLDGPDPQAVTTTVNAIATAYQRQNIERKSAEAEQTLSFVDEQLPRVQHALETAEDALNKYRLSQKSADLTKETELALQQGMALEERRLELQQKREEALRRFTPGHPVIQGIDAQLEGIVAEQKTLAARVKTLPETQQELLRLSREIGVNNALYTSLLNNAEQLRIAKAGTIGNVRIVDMAVLPTEATWPNPAFAMSLAFLTGLFSAAVVVYVRRAFISGVSDPAIIEQSLGLPTYASIPYTPAQIRISRKLGKGNVQQGLLTAVDPHDPAIEAIRSLRTALHFEKEKGVGNVLLICGPASGLGKSFVSANFAAILAMTGSKVVLVDADLRRGHLHQFLAQPRGKGLADFLAASCEYEDIVRPSSTGAVCLISTGTIPANPAELLLNPRFDQLVERLSRDFDHVIMDSPPVLAVADTMIASRAASSTLLVLKSGEHSLRIIAETVRRFRAAGGKIRGVIFNQVGRNPVYGYRAAHYEYRRASADQQ